MLKRATATYQPRRPADENQRAALKKMRGREAFALLMAMRMRKSKVIIDEFGEMELAGEVQDLCVIAPAGCYRTWVQALDDDLSDDLRERIHVHAWSSGSGVGERNRRAEFLRDLDWPRCLIMNVEALSRPGEARKFLETFLIQGANKSPLPPWVKGQKNNGRGSMVVCDESTVLKNPGAKRTKYLLKVVRPLAAYRRILSGLPTPRSPLDLYSQFEFLDWRILGHKSWWTFRASIAHLRQQWFGGRSVIMIDNDRGVNGFKPEAVEQLQKAIAPHSFRVEFRPKVPTTYSIREVEMTKEQKKAYEEIREFATTQLSDGTHVTATVVIAQIMRLHQVLMGHVKDEHGIEHAIPQNRIVALMELLEDYGGKALVWCSYEDDVLRVAAAIAVEYGKDSVARFWGGNIRSREEEDRRFKTDPRCRFSVGTPSAGGRGRTLDVADLAVYYSSTDNLEHRDQSEQRTMGRDKARGVDVVDLICRGTVEEKILDALRRKINMAQVINGDSWREWIV